MQDFPLGQIKIKKGGGNGGHNGLANIVSHLGTSEFYRLRIGINHPGGSHQVLKHVLGKMHKEEEAELVKGFPEVLNVLPLIINGNFDEAMNHLH